MPPQSTDAEEAKLPVLNHRPHELPELEIMGVSESSEQSISYPGVITLDNSQNAGVSLELVDLSVMLFMFTVRSNAPVVMFHIANDTSLC